MTAGREQDARETLRASVMHVLALHHDERGDEGLYCTGCGWRASWEDDEPTYTEHLVDAVMALLPSPPATTTRVCTLCGGSDVRTDCYACDGFGNVAAPSPPATTGAGALNDLRALIDEALSGGATAISIDLPSRHVDPSPPATTGAGEGLTCPDCGHRHTPDGCDGPPTASDRWAGVSPAICDCPADPSSPPATDGDAADGGTR